MPSARHPEFLRLWTREQAAVQDLWSHTTITWKQLTPIPVCTSGLYQLSSKVFVLSSFARRKNMSQQCFKHIRHVLRQKERGILSTAVLGPPWFPASWQLWPWWQFLYSLKARQHPCQDCSSASCCADLVRREEALGVDTCHTKRPQPSTEAARDFGP